MNTAVIAAVGEPGLSGLDRSLTVCFQFLASMCFGPVRNSPALIPKILMLFASVAERPLHRTEIDALSKRGIFCMQYSDRSGGQAFYAQTANS